MFTATTEVLKTPLAPAVLGLPGGMELVVILLVILLLFGNKLPGMARNLGRSFIEFKKGVKGTDEPKQIPGEGNPLEERAKGIEDKP